MQGRPPVAQAMIDLYDRFTHDGGMSRRDLIARLAKLAGSSAAAAAILPLIEARAAAAPLTRPDDGRLYGERVVFRLPGERQMVGYMAQQRRGAERMPKVMVIHENRGLNDHIKDVTRRLALSGFVAFAPDFLAPMGETPRSGDGDKSADDIARQMIGALDRKATIEDALASLAWFDSYHMGRGVPAALGFCWGGGMVNELAVAAGRKLRAGVAYYGPAPADLAQTSRIKARMLLQYAGLDERINAGAPAYRDALKAAGVTFAAHTYPNVNHAFNNDTSEARYNREAADLAWRRTLAWLQI